MIRFATWMFIFLNSGIAIAATSFTNIDKFDVHPSNKNVFSTPLAFKDGNLFVVNIESAGSDEKIGLETFIRHYKEREDGAFVLHGKALIEPGTLNDPYHTQPSVGIDENGYVHVAYNMHNMPWQYKVSDLPLSISGFSFLGEKLRKSDRFAVKVLNRTYFPGLGKAKIPGNQITYPAFFNDRYGRLFITYRFAVRPARKFKERDYAGGIARYSAMSKSWEPIGGEVMVESRDMVGDGRRSVHPFAYYSNSAVYLLRLHFDSSNQMHVSWFWRLIGAGADVSRLSYVYSPDHENFYTTDGPVSLPISISDALVFRKSKAVYSPLSSIVTRGENPLITYQKFRGKRYYATFDKEARKWIERRSIFGSAVLAIGRNNDLFAFATGVKVYKQDADKWREFASSDSQKARCYPKVLFDGNSRFFVHSTDCGGKNVSIDWFDS